MGKPDRFTKNENNLIKKWWKFSKLFKYKGHKPKLIKLKQVLITKLVEKLKWKYNSTKTEQQVRFHLKYLRKKSTISYDQGILVWFFFAQGFKIILQIISKVVTLFFKSLFSWEFISIINLLISEFEAQEIDENREWSFFADVMERVQNEDGKGKVGTQGI